MKHENQIYPLYDLCIILVCKIHWIIKYMSFHILFIIFNEIDMELMIKLYEYYKIRK